MGKEEGMECREWLMTEDVNLFTSTEGPGLDMNLVEAVAKKVRQVLGR